MTATRGGLALALGAGAVFGVGAPITKLLLGDLDPRLLAGVLYLGSGVGLLVVRRVHRAPRQEIPPRAVPRLVLTVALGGVAGPLLLLVGLRSVAASSASLLLTLEGVLTAVLAWALFGEHATRALVAGMLAVVAGSVVLAWPGNGAGAMPLVGVLAVVGACACWALDNNLTRDLDALDATWLACAKGLVAGTVNLALAVLAGHAGAPVVTLAIGAALGFVSYGVSIVWYVRAQRLVGTARTGACFGIAPFVGALLAVALGEPVTPALVVAGALMALGAGVHLAESHEHQHVHPELVHTHEHRHDDGHHEHDESPDAAVRHTHEHAHPRLAHTHGHFPDVHHRHVH